MIQELHKENLSLHKKLSKQVNVIQEAFKYVKERNSILHENENLNSPKTDMNKNYKSFIAFLILL